MKLQNDNARFNPLARDKAPVICEKPVKSSAHTLCLGIDITGGASAYFITISLECNAIANGPTF